MNSKSVMNENLNSEQDLNAALWVACATASYID
jgi:hypothetical protein